MRILVFGDSIAWGACDEKEGGWVGRLKVFYRDTLEQQVYNLGISGDNTDDLLKRFETEVKARTPKNESLIIIFAIGVNDSQYVRSLKQNRVPIDKFEKNLQKLINLAKKYTKKIMFVGLTNVDESKTKPIPWNLNEEYTNDFIKKYDKLIKSICNKNKIKFILLSGKLTNNLLDDGLHPNAKGHELMFKTIKKYLK